MITEEKNIYSGKMNDYAADHLAEQDWGVNVVKSADNSRITVQLVDSVGSLREIVVEIAHNAPQVMAYGEGSDEPLFIAKVGHDAALLSRNLPDPSGYDFIRFDGYGMNRTSDGTLEHEAPALEA